MREIVLILNNSYDLAEWEKSIIKRCMVDNPSFNIEELSELLGIAAVTLRRKIKEYKIELSNKEKKLILASFKNQKIKS